MEPKESVSMRVSLTGEPAVWRRSFFAEGIEADHLRRSGGFLRRQVMTLAACDVGPFALAWLLLFRLGLEIQAELHAGIDKCRQCGERNRQSRRHFPERQRHLEMVVLDLQSPELMLKDDGH